MPEALDIVVPVYRNAALTKACIESLLLHLSEVVDHRPRIIVVNDSPGDAEVEALLTTLHGQDPIVVIGNERNVGFVRTANRGLLLALERGADALLVNSDTLTFPGTLRHLVSGLCRDRAIGFVCPRSNNASFCSLPHRAGSASEPETARHDWALLQRHLPPFHFAPTTVGFYCLVSRHVLADVGLLDEAFGVGYEEENDLVMRAARFGFRSLVANRAFAFHHGSASFALADLDAPVHRDRNLAFLENRHPAFPVAMAAFENSPRFRAEALLDGLLPDAKGRLRIALDLSELDAADAGRAGALRDAIAAVVRLHSDRLRITALCSELSLERLGLAESDGLAREDAGAGGLHGIGVRFGATPDARDLRRLSDLAPINLFAFPPHPDDERTMSADVATAWDRIQAFAHGLLFEDAPAAEGFAARRLGVFGGGVLQTPLPGDSDAASIGRSPSDADAWADAFATFCAACAAEPTLFERLNLRLLMLDGVEAGTVPTPAASPVGHGQRAQATAAKAVDLDALLAMSGSEFVQHAYATLLGRPADGAGLDFYGSQLRDGVERLDILDALAISAEGRVRNRPLAGLDERLRARARRWSHWIKRLLGR